MRKTDGDITESTGLPRDTAYMLTRDVIKGEILTKELFGLPYYYRFRTGKGAGVKNDNSQETDFTIISRENIKNYLGKKFRGSYKAKVVIYREMFEE